MRQFYLALLLPVFCGGLCAAEFLDLKNHPLAGKLDARLIPAVDAVRKTQSTDAQAAADVKAVHTRAVQATPLPEQLAVRLDVAVTAANLKSIKGTGAVISSTAEQWDTVCVHATVSQIDALVQLGFVKHVALQSKPRRRTQGSASNQGDAVMTADQLRATYGLTGAGQTIGVISDSVTDTRAVGSGTVSGTTPNAVVTGTKPQLTGDLPASFQVVDFGPGGGTDEGEGMMEVIHDVAPGAALVFGSSGNDQTQCATNLSLLRTAGNCNITVDDIGFSDEPFFQDGPIAQAAGANQAAGVLHFSAFGNDGNQAILSSFKPISAASDNALSPPDGSCFHDWGNGIGAFLPVTVPGRTSVSILLQWDQPFSSFKLGAGSNADLDLYICPSTTFSYNAVLGKSENRQGTVNTPSGDPMEEIDYTNNSNSARTVYLVINHYQGSRTSSTGSSGNNFRVIFDDDGSGTLPLTNPVGGNAMSGYGHPTSKNMVAVGAVDCHNPSIPENYTSKGGNVPFYFDTNGAASFVNRVAPDLCAPDGVDTSVFGADSDNDGFPNFYGTSCAAPNAAAAAALVLQNSSATAPAALLALLKSTATDITLAPTEDPQQPMTGVDAYSGAGLINALAAGNANATAPVFTSALSASGNVGSMFSYTVAAQGTNPITFSAANLPPGLSFSGTTLSGIPTVQQTFNVVLTAVNSKGSTVVTLVVTIGAPVPVTITSGPVGKLNPSFATQVVNFSVTASGSGRGLTYAWNFGDGGTATGQQPVHVFAKAENYTVKVTVTDVNGQTAVGTLTEVIQPFIPLAFTSALQAAPLIAGIGQTVNASSAASGNGTLSYNWDFGDGSQAAGATASHQYIAAGLYKIVVTVTDMTSQSINAQLIETVKVTLIGTGFDSDGDGVSDSVEVLAHTNPTDPASTPLANPNAAATGLTLNSLRIKLNFLSSGRDQVKLLCGLPIDAGTQAANATVLYNIGGIENSALLNARGQGITSDGGKLTLRIKSVRGAVPAQTARLTLTLPKGSYASTLSGDGLVNATTFANVSVPVQILFGGAIYSTNASLSYTGKYGRTGAAK